MNGRLEHDIEREETIKGIVARMPDFVAEWDTNLKASQKTTSTRYDYNMKVWKFMRSVNENCKVINPEEITIKHLQDFFVSIQTREKNGEIVETSDSFRCTYWYVLNNLFKYLLKRKYIKDNPMELIECPKNHDLDRINQHRTLLTEEDFKKIIQAVDNDYMCDLNYKSRNKLILLLFMTTGMRKTALTEINIGDIEDDILTVVDKRKKTHTYTLNNIAMDCLDIWLYKRKRLVEQLGSNTDALFINKFGDRMATYAIDDVVKKYAEKGLGYKISPHKLRAGLSSILYHKTHDLEFVRRAIGHSNIATTQRYVVTEGKEKEEMAKMIGEIFD